MAHIQSRQLDVGVLVPYPLLQRAHGIFRLHCLGSNHVGDLEVEGHVLSALYQHVLLQLAQQVACHVQARGCRALNLLVERAVGRRPEPARHGVWMCASIVSFVMFP